MKPTIKVKKNEESPEPIELLAKSIIEVSEGFEKINKSGLNRRGLIVLLQDMIGAKHIWEN